MSGPFLGLTSLFLGEDAASFDGDFFLFFLRGERDLWASSLLIVNFALDFLLDFSNVDLGLTVFNVDFLLLSVSNFFLLGDYSLLLSDNRAFVSDMKARSASASRGDTVSLFDDSFDLSPRFGERDFLLILRSEFMGLESREDPRGEMELPCLPPFGGLKDDFFSFFSFFFFTIGYLTGSGISPDPGRSNSGVRRDKGVAWRDSASSTGVGGRGTGGSSKSDIYLPWSETLWRRGLLLSPELPPML